MIWAAFEATDATGFSRNVAVMDKLRLALRPLIEGTLEQVACELRNGSPTLTDAEREAIERAIDRFDGVEDVSAGSGARDASARCSLRGLLERTQNG